MYAGHLGIALGAYGVRPRIGLAWFVVAALLCDLANAVLSLANIPDEGARYSHGLPYVAAAAILLAAITWLRSGNRGASIAVGICVLLHLPADYLTSTRLSIWPGGPAIGLRIYQRPILDFALEAVLIIMGWWLYRTAIRSETRRNWPHYSMLAILLAFQAWFCTLGIT
jgi:hypothetical protein